MKKNRLFKISLKKNLGKKGNLNCTDNYDVAKIKVKSATDQRETDRHRRQAKRQTDKQTNRETVSQSVRQTDSQTDKQTERKMHIDKQIIKICAWVLPSYSIVLL